MNKKSESMGLVILLILSILISYSYSVSADLYFDDNTVFQVDNENYTFPDAGITFSQVSYDESGSWIKFNSTDFNVTSTNPINITLSSLNDDIASAASDELVLEFDADTTAGTVYFNISGFTSDETYTVYRDTSVLGYYTANATNYISFTNNVWSSHTFKIYVGTNITCTCTGYEYGNWSHSEHVNGTDDLEEAWSMNNDNWTTSDLSAWWAGNYTMTYNLSNNGDDIGYAILNESGMNRSQSFGWVKTNFTGETKTTVFPMIIFSYNSSTDFDAVLVAIDSVYFMHYNGTNLTELDSGLTWDEIDLMHTWTNNIDLQYEQNGYLSEGLYWKLLYNEYTGKVKFKFWGPNFMAEPVGWAAEYAHTNLTHTSFRCYGIGVYNPDGFFDGTNQMHFDLVNLWQLNYTVNSSATMTISGDTYDRPHMEYPVYNLSNFTTYWEYLADNSSKNFSAVDTIRTVMKDFITNPMNMESRMWEPLVLEADDQNDTIYYYSCLYDNMRNFTEQIVGEYPDWMYDEYLHLHVQVCPDGDFDDAGSGTFYDDLIVAIDVDDDGSWDSNDRLFWMGADGLREQLNGDTWVLNVDYNGTVWLSDTNASGNLHRYEQHMNYGFNLPLATLVKSDGYPLNTSDVFGLNIMVFDDGAETCAVWQNWNETSGSPIYPEASDISLAQYFLGYDSEEEPCFDITGTELGRWGEGVIPGLFNVSGDLTYHMTVDVAWNDTVALAGEDYCLVNMSVIVNNTGTGTLDDIYLNQSWWNCSCSDLNMTFVDSNQSHSNFTWFNDSCYWWIHNGSVTLASGEFWSFYVNLNITACPGTTTATETITTVGNATNLIGTVNGDTITFQWGYTPHIRVSWGNAALAAVTEANYGILVFMSLLAMVIVAVIIIAYVSKFSGGGV